MRNSSRWFSSGFLIALCAVALSPARAMADPVITGFNSTQVPLQSFLIIYGSGFGDAQGESFVTMGSRQVPVEAWADNAIHVLVNPMAYNQGPVVLDAVYPVQVVIPSSGKSSNIMNVTITSGPPPVYAANPSSQTFTDQPALTGFQGKSFCPGNSIAIYGVGFGNAQGASYVSVTVPLLDAHGNPFTQEYQIPVLGWSESAINALLSLPAGAQPGSYTLTVHRANGKTSSGSFTVPASCD